MIVEEDSISPTRQAWLDNLKKGDPVVIRFARQDSLEFEYYGATVDMVGRVGEEGPWKIYASGKVFDHTGRFFSSHVLVEPTPENLLEVERTKLIDRMSELRWKRLPVTVLVKIVSVAEADAWVAEILEKKALKEG